MVNLSKFYVIFMTLMHGLDLEEAWPQLDDNQKRDMTNQVDIILSDLRSPPFPEKQPLGGVKGEGCKDARRDIRISSSPIMTVKDFEDFLFSKPNFGSPVYLKFLSCLHPPEEPVPDIVFTSHMATFDQLTSRCSRMRMVAGKLLA